MAKISNTTAGMGEGKRRPPIVEQVSILSEARLFKGSRDVLTLTIVLRGMVPWEKRCTKIVSISLFI